MNQAGKILLVAIAIAAVGAWADECNVYLLQSPNITHIQTSSGSSEIVVTSPSEWEALTKGTSGDKIINANGDVNENVSPADEESFQTRSRNLGPTAVNDFTQNGRKLVLQSTDGQWSVRSFSNGTHLLSARNGDLAAVGLDRDLGDNLQIKSIFVQNTSVVTYVDGKCQVVTLPKDKLDPEVQQLLEELSQTADADGEMHILPFNFTDGRFPPPPPPPPHGGPPGPPPHGGPFGPYPPPPPPHGGPHGPPPPHGGPFGPPPPFGPFGPHQPQSPFGRPQQPPSFPPPQGQQQMNDRYSSPSQNGYPQPRPSEDSNQNNGFPSPRSNDFAAPQASGNFYRQPGLDANSVQNRANPSSRAYPQPTGQQQQSQYFNYPRY